MTLERGVPELVTALMEHVEELKTARAKEAEATEAAAALILELEKMNFRITIPELQFVVQESPEAVRPVVGRVEDLPLEGILVANTPVPASLGANLAAGRPDEEEPLDRSVDQEMSQSEWEAEVARRAAVQDNRSAEAIHNDSRVTPEAAATGVGGFQANIGSDYSKIIAAGLMRSAVLQSRGGGVD